jgi:hypothetical protein
MLCLVQLLENPQPWPHMPVLSTKQEGAGCMMKEKEIDQTFITAEDVAAFLFRVDHD